MAYGESRKEDRGEQMSDDSKKDNDVVEFSVWWNSPKVKTTPLQIWLAARKGMISRQEVEKAIDAMPTHLGGLFISKTELKRKLGVG